MKIRFQALWIAILVFVWIAAAPALPGVAQGVAQGGQAVVHAVLFFSPDCAHCHEVMEKYLPPLVEKYGPQLDIAGVDVTHPVGQELYQTMLNTYRVPDERIGVPTLVVGDQVLVGSIEIPELLPAIVEQGLAAGGIDWPNISGLQPVLDSQAGSPLNASTGAAAASSAAAAPAQNVPPFILSYLKDPLANTIALVVLLVMLHLVIYVGVKFLQGQTSRLLNWPRWTIPALSVIGIGVAAYLSYIELTATEALCGPVGDCHSVQTSPYAFLFGILPVGVLGLAGYLAIVAAWWTKENGPLNLRKTATLALWGFAWFGILFSIYLTFLEPFVIGATCAWCITSAVVMSLVFLASSGPAIQSMSAEEIDEDEDEEEDPAIA